MPRVETIVPVPVSVQEPEKSGEAIAAGSSYGGAILRLPASAIQTRTNARPGPEPLDEQSRIASLVQSLRLVGQILPLVVERGSGDTWWVVAGRRRLTAAWSIAPDYMLDCVVLRDGLDPLQVAIHENAKRRGYNPIQYAHLVAAVRSEKGFTGTKEIAAYMGCSRAQIQQHDRLLMKPAAMDDATYAGLLEDLNGGRMRADAAFYALTHVKESRAGKVLERAAEIAKSEERTEPAKAVASEKPAATTRKTPPDAPRVSNERESASQRVTEPTKTAPAAPVTPVVRKRHVAQAAKEQKAIREDAPKARGRAAASASAGTGTIRTVPELRRLFDTLRDTKYPDPMRSFISVVADTWWRGDSSDREVVQHWSQISALVKDSLKRARPVKKAKSASSSASRKSRRSK